MDEESPAIKGELQEKDEQIKRLNAKYEQDFRMIKEEMTKQFVQIMK
ncbi:MAG: hypothetical protein M3Q77_03060 [Thermoproteota archaeon]|nr:hypothetical protein [Nitrosopumilus sp.]MDQ3083776.1 hypothetical protein [Thermoproteota archaeon]